MSTKSIDLVMNKYSNHVRKETAPIINDPLGAIKRIEVAQSIIILMSGPDNDSIGSGIVLKRFFRRKYGINVDLVCKKLSARYSELPHIDEIKVIDPAGINYKKYDLIVTVDTSNPYPQLVDPNVHAEFILPRSCPILSIDHHRGNEGFADFNIWETNVSSVCELIYKYILIKEAIERDEATLLLCGISGDTGHFRWALSDETLNIANELVKLGGDFDFVVNQEFNHVGKGIPKLLQVFLSRMEFRNNLGISITTFDYRELNGLGITIDDYKQARSIYLSSFSKSMEGYPIGVFLAQSGKYVEGHLFGNTFENKIDLTQLSLWVGGNGGGHFQASGFLVEGNIVELTKKVVDAVSVIRAQEGKQHGKIQK